MYGITVLCLVAQLCMTLCEPMHHSPPGSPVLGDSPGKNTGVGCHAILQGIFPTLGIRSPALQLDSLLSEPPGKPMEPLRTLTKAILSNESKEMHETHYYYLKCLKTERYWKQQERNNSYKQESLNKNISLFLGRNHENKSTVGWYWDKNIVTCEVCIWQKCPAKIREKLRHSQINKCWMNLLLPDLPCKQC